MEQRDDVGSLLFRGLNLPNHATPCHAHTASMPPRSPQYKSTRRYTYCTGQTPRKYPHPPTHPPTVLVLSFYTPTGNNHHHHRRVTLVLQHTLLTCQAHKGTRNAVPYRAPCRAVRCVGNRIHRTTTDLRTHPRTDLGTDPRINLRTDLRSTITPAERRKP